jgi:glycosyltransferase involved in cell wall biosynthesis
MAEYSNHIRRLLPFIVLHDYYENADGGGRLCLTLAKSLNGHLCYGYKQEQHPYFRDNERYYHEHNLDVFSRIRILKQISLIRAFSKRTGFLESYDTVVYSGFYSVNAVQQHCIGRNIYYCHTPPRYIYDQKKQYEKQAGILGRPILRYFNRKYKPMYEMAVQQMDLILANSYHVKNRIKRYLHLNSEVVYPPCNTNRFRFLGQGKFYLSTARIDPLKRVETIVRAFLDMPEKELIVVSSGTNYPRICKLALGVPNIKVLGWVTEQRLAELIGNCIATIYIPKDEDFGMSPVESMAAGKPVIGVREGGLRETILDGETGILLPPDPEIASVKEAVHSLSAEKATGMKFACQQQAQRFSAQKFARNMERYLHQ